jgi:nicotinamide riboside kinase
MKITFVGPESSGKTTLTQKCHEKFGGSLISEFARDYLEVRNGSYKKIDLDAMAKVQFERILLANSKLNFIDTELITFKIWSEFKYKSCSDLILELLEQQQIDFYFLCKPDIPWEYDELRENENERDELFTLFQNELQVRNLPYKIIKGDFSDRINACFSEIEKLIK